MNLEIIKNRREKMVGGGSVRALRLQKRFREAWAKAGYPRYFKWDNRCGRIWTREARAEDLQFKTASSSEQRAILAERKLEADRFLLTERRL